MMGPVAFGIAVPEHLRRPHGQHPASEIWKGDAGFASMSYSQLRCICRSVNPAFRSRLDRDPQKSYATERSVVRSSSQTELALQIVQRFQNGFGIHPCTPITACTFRRMTRAHPRKSVPIRFAPTTRLSAMKHPPAAWRMEVMA